MFAAGLTAEILNFQKLSVARRRRCQTKGFNGKGHSEQMLAWAGFLRGEREHPLPFAQIRSSMQLTFPALESIQQGQPVDIEAP